MPTRTYNCTNLDCEALGKPFDIEGNADAICPICGKQPTQPGSEDDQKRRWSPQLKVVLFSLLALGALAVTVFRIPSRYHACPAGTVSENGKCVSLPCPSGVCPPPEPLPPAIGKADEGLQQYYPDLPELPQQ